MANNRFRKVLAVLLIAALSWVACPVQAQSQGDAYRNQRNRTGIKTATQEPSQKTRNSSRAAILPQQNCLLAAVEEVDAVEDAILLTNYTQMPGQDCCDDSQIHCGDRVGYCPPMWNPVARCRPCDAWVRVEYLGWWKQGMDLPPLVTTNPTADPTLEDADTTILFGDDTVNKDATSGGRSTIGIWADSCHLRGLEFTYMGLGSETTSFHASGDDYDILGRPFFNIQDRSADASLINSTTPANTGWVNVTAETTFQGTELLYRRVTRRSPSSQVDLLLGWRWLQLEDDLLIAQSVTQAGVGTVALSDRFDTENNFHGAECGIEFSQPLSYCWTFELLGKLAIGGTHSSVLIDGQQTSDADQGLLALDSNSGTHSRNSFSAVTEIGLSMKRRFQCGVEATFRYTLVYWGDVTRAGDQIDLDVDPRQIPPSPQSGTHPALLMDTTDFWAQGLHIGLEYDF